MEAWYEGDWHLYDPDLRVVPRTDDGEILSVEELAVSPYLERYYSPYAADIVASRENNSYASYPGSRFVWKQNVLVYVEHVAEFLKFLMPVLLIVAAAWSALRRREPKATP